MNTDGLKGETAVSEAVIGAAFRVANTLGCGFLEKVYENSLTLELRLDGYEVQQQATMNVWYRGQIVGLYQADLVVDGSVIVELKAQPAVERIHRAQCLNYLRATGLRTGLVINFGLPRLQVQRVISDAA